MSGQYIENKYGVLKGDLIVFRFNGQAVPGSPFSCKVSPGNTQPRVPISGSGIELAAVGHPADIKIDVSSGNIDIIFI